MQKKIFFILAVSSFMIVSELKSQTITGSNGLLKVINDIQLGGALTTPTKIITGSNYIWFKTNFNSSEKYNLNNADGHFYIGDSANIPLSTIEQNNGGVEYWGNQNAAALIVTKTKANNNENVDLFSMATADASSRNGWLFRNYSNSIGNVSPQLLTYSNAPDAEGYSHQVYGKDNAAFSAYRILLKSYDSLNLKAYAWAPIKKRVLFSIDNGENKYGFIGYSLFQIDSIGKWSGYAYKNTDSNKVLSADANGNIVLKSSAWTTIGSNIYNNTTANIGIGTTDTKGYKLAVNGSAIFTKATVKPSAAWPDYVFSPEYKLTPLDSLEEFIQLNKHLPEVPSADEVQKDGVDLGDNQALLLKKIEELTLIVIEQNKQIQELKSRLPKQGKVKHAF